MLNKNHKSKKKQLLNDTRKPWFFLSKQSAKSWTKCQNFLLPSWSSIDACFWHQRLTQHMALAFVIIHQKEQKLSIGKYCIRAKSVLRGNIVAGAKNRKKNGTDDATWRRGVTIIIFPEIYEDFSWYDAWHRLLIGCCVYFVISSDFHFSTFLKATLTSVHKRNCSNYDIHAGSPKAACKLFKKQ